MSEDDVVHALADRIYNDLRVLYYGGSLSDMEKTSVLDLLEWAESMVNTVQDVSPSWERWNHSAGKLLESCGRGRA